MRTISFSSIFRNCLSVLKEVSNSNKEGKTTVFKGKAVNNFSLMIFKNFSCIESVHRQLEKKEKRYKEMKSLLMGGDVLRSQIFNHLIRLRTVSSFCLPFI